MAITRIPRKNKTFVYGETEFELRPPTTQEQAEITNKLAAYQRTVRDEIKKDVADNIFNENSQNGDLALMIDVQKYIARWLVVDKVSGENIFSDDKNDPNHEHVDDAPADFITEAFFCHTGQNVRQYKSTELVDVFGEAFVKEYSIVFARIVQAKIEEIEKTDPKAAHDIRIKLDLKGGARPLETGMKPTTPETDATTT